MISRRRLLSAGAALGAVAVLPAGFGRRAAAQGRPFTFCSWGGALSETEKQAFMDPFAEMKGIEIANVSPTNYAKIEAMVEATLALCDCGPERTGKVHVSLDLLAELGIAIPSWGALGP